MSEQTRKKYTAEYLYPGFFMPEEETREVSDGTYAAVIAAQPNDGWYAVEVREITQRLYRADNGDEQWVKEGKSQRIGSWVVGEKIYWEDIPDTDANRILRSNIRSNSKDGFGVKTRCGNWQIASDYLEVVAA